MKIYFENRNTTSGKESGPNMKKQPEKMERC